MDLFHYMEEKLKLLEKFLAATELLQRKLDPQEIGGLRGLLEERQGLIRRIDKIDDQVMRLLQKEPLAGSRCSDETKDKMSFFSSAVVDILHEVEVLNQGFIHKIISCQNEIKRDLSRMKSDVKAARCYAATPIVVPRFVDMTK